MNTATDPVWIDLTAEVLEDLHTGSGTGGGDIDALVQRDRHGRPVIRASHLRGLLREAAEELVALGVLDEATKLDLFGDNKGSRSRLRLASLRTDEARLLVWGSTARVEGKRNPKRDTLRHVEHVAAGTVFTGRLRLPDASHHELMLRLLARIDRVGGDRSRGSGLVKLTHSEQPMQPRETPKSATRLRIVLRNIEPLCLPATGQPGNLIESQSLVRGQALRGALMAWAIETGREALLELFAHVSIGDALPLPEGLQQADAVLPIPLSILTDKPGAGDPSLPWWTGLGVQPPATRDGLRVEQPSNESSREKPKRPGPHEYLCSTDAGKSWQRYAPQIAVRLRNATPRRNTRDDAELFSLEEIAEDTCFQADLVFGNPDAAERFATGFAPLLGGGDWLALGRGGLPVAVASVSAAADAPLASIKDEGWSLTLASDLIIRGEHLGFLEDLDIRRLCRWAGIEPDPGWTLQDKRFVETETIRGFNAVTGLQRAPALAIRRGSCWRVTGPGSARLADALAALPALGERGEEGFGRFVIGLQPIGTLGKPAGQVRPLVQNHAEEMLHAARSLAKAIPSPGPSRSQLQWLRQAALAACDEQQLEGLLKEVETAPTRRERSGGAWRQFPLDRLRRELDELPGIVEKRLFIAQIVALRTTQAEEPRK